MDDDSDEEDAAADRRRLLDEIAIEAADTASWTGRSAFSERVMAAMAKVPRHLFVPQWERPFAYLNRPLGIGHGQTISQPYIVALMTELLDVEPTDRLLEVGTGCGYQAAVLAELALHVCSIEVVPDLASEAALRLARLGYNNVEIKTGDGYQGWPEKAPFDGIIVTAAPTEIPTHLREQLRTGGRLVIPVGPRHETQILLRCVKQEDGSLMTEEKLPVAFVPMIHPD
jgi:protein-L-isoaspartate(D-aspartate) O-methyltransferase